MRWTQYVAGAAMAAAITTSAHAGLSLQATRNPDPAPGLESYLITAVGDGENVVTISALKIDGNVHQVWPYSSNDGTRLPGELSGVFWHPDWNALDTHLLVPANKILTTLGSISETNNNSNPTGLNLSLPDPFSAFKPTIGLGLFGMSDDGAFALLPAAQSPSVDLLQIVIPAGSNALIDVQLIGSVTGGGVEINDFSVLVPEPTSLAALLGLAGCAMLGRRQQA